MILGCNKDHVEVRHRSKGVVARFTTYKQFKEWMLKNQDGDEPIMASSSMDFPEEYTSNKKIIALCDKIRSEE